MNMKIKNYSSRESRKTCLSKCAAFCCDSTCDPCGIELIEYETIYNEPKKRYIQSLSIFHYRLQSLFDWALLFVIGFVLACVGLMVEKLPHFIVDYKLHLIDHLISRPFPSLLDSSVSLSAPIGPPFFHSAAHNPSTARCWATSCWI